MRFSFTIFLCLVSLFSFAQVNSGVQLYESGIHAFNQKEYKAADSLFTASLNIQPHAKTYYNLAVTKLQLNDSCGFCFNLRKASDYKDMHAGRLYEAKCFNEPHTIVYLNEMDENVVCHQIIRSDKCESNKLFDYFVKYLDKDSTARFSIAEFDKVVLRSDTLFTPEYTIPNFNFDDLIYTTCEEMPHFPGGEQALFKFVQSNVKYPHDALESGVQGRVYVTFVVTNTGAIKDVCILRSLSDSIDKEAVRVVNLMPRWSPAKQSGKPVSVQYNLPVNFTVK